MKKKVMVTIFIVILVLPMVSWPLVSLFDLPTLDENREKAPFPKFGDDLFSQFDKYFADRAPYRDLLIRLYNNVARKLGLLYEGMIYPNDGADDPDDGDPDGNTGDNPNENTPEKPDFFTSLNGAIFGQNDWLFYTGDNSVSYYKGNNLPTEAELRDYVARAEKVNNYFKSLGKQFIIFIAPNKEQIYSEYMPRGISVVNKVKRADVIYNYFKEHSNVTVLYPKAELLEAKKNGVLYYQQDTHWNELGGWIGAKALLKALNITPSNVTISETTHYGGDLAMMAAMNPAAYTAYNVSYRPEITVETKLFNLYESEYQSSNKNGKTLLMIGDSFREAMRGVLAKEFEYSIFNNGGASTGYFGWERRYTEEFFAADVIVFEAVERLEYTQMFTDWWGFLQRVIDIYGL